MANKQKLTREQKKGKTLASMSFTAGLAAFIAAYSGSVLKKGILSKFFTFLAGAMVFMTALFTQDKGVDADATDVDD
ncbi:MAG: hypothetical protein ILO43_06025 [Clostridia bacterium]|nr:hypothetical protein [Clostridia bacterium]MBP5272498.1 hypothetical protein [Clostridia bacterium]MBP5459112.1 hypothetical protein [Clostridia bacterium]